MRHYFRDPADFIGLIEAFPGGITKLRQHLLAFGIFVSDTVQFSHEVWRNMCQEKGEDRSADILAEIIISKCGDRVLGLIRAQADEDDEVYLRADDPDIAHALFADEYLDSDLGYFVADYYERSRGPAAAPGESARRARGPDPPNPGTEDLQREIDALRAAVDDITAHDLDDTFTLNVLESRESAPLNSGRGFDRVFPAQRDLLVADPDWLEEDLEEHIWEHWEQIDFGVPAPLVLFGRQVQITENSRDRVDILAKGPRGAWYAIELKIVEARSKDFTQLQSYVAQLVQRGVPQLKAHGLLIAPGFGDKVINAGGNQSSIQLLRFQKP